MTEVSEDGSSKKLGVRVMDINDAMTHIDPADYYRPGGLYGYMPAPLISSAYYLPVVLSGSGLALSVLTNVFKKRPMIAAVQRHVAFLAFGALAGIYLERYLQRRAATRDEFIYDYILHHPEDFPPIERVKYGQILQRWCPYR